MKACYYETDIPIITDAEVVEAEVVPVNVQHSALPPPINPNYVPSTKSTSLATTAPPMPKTFLPHYQQQQQTPSSPLPVSAYVNTAMVATTSTTFQTPTPRIIRTMGRTATGLVCPYCHRQTVTVVEDYIGIGTVIAVFLLAIFFWPICWLPLCVPTCRRTHHYCGHPTCHQKIGETRVCA
jgi:LITAF-like zinc ribbon domain